MRGRACDQVRAAGGRLGPTGTRATTVFQRVNTQEASGADDESDSGSDSSSTSSNSKSELPPRSKVHQKLEKQKELLAKTKQTMQDKLQKQKELLAKKVAALQENKEKVKELKRKFRSWRHKNPESELSKEFTLAVNVKGAMPAMKEAQVPMCVCVCAHACVLGCFVWLSVFAFVSDVLFMYITHRYSI